MDESKPNAPKFDLNPTPIVTDKTTLPISMFNYHPTELRIMVVYGSDLRPSRRGPIQKYWGFKSSKIVMATGFVTSVLLCLIRKRLRLRHNGFFHSWIDILISVFGGGRIQFTHRFERLYFAAMWMMFLFINTFLGALMFDTTWPNADKILSIDDIITMTPPIFLSPTLQENEQSIKAILRFDFYWHIFHFLPINSSFFLTPMFLSLNCSDKLGSNHRYAGIQPFAGLLDDHQTAFAYVVDESTVNTLEAMAKAFRDVDLIDESLGNHLHQINYCVMTFLPIDSIYISLSGSVDSRYFLVSDHHIPHRLMEKLQQRTNWMIAGGIYRFYDTLGAHLANLRAQRLEEDDDNGVPPISINLMKYVLKVCSAYIFYAWIFLLVENIVFYIKNRQNRRIRIQPQPKLKLKSRPLQRRHTI